MNGNKVDSTSLDMDGTEMMDMNQDIDENFAAFISIWNNLESATREVTSILHHSAQRCSYKVVS